MRAFFFSFFLGGASRWFFHSMVLCYYDFFCSYGLFFLCRALLSLYLWAEEGQEDYEEDGVMGEEEEVLDEEEEEGGSSEERRK